MESLVQAQRRKSNQNWRGRHLKGGRAAKRDHDRRVKAGPRAGNVEGCVDWSRAS